MTNVKSAEVLVVGAGPVDETGWRIDGVSSWLWSFSNETISVYVIDPSRGQGVVEEVLGEVFSGVLCSDFYGAYHKIESLKQKCWAHILRDLHNLREKYPKNLEILYFASRMKDFFDRGNSFKRNEVIEPLLSFYGLPDLVYFF